VAPKSWHAGKNVLGSTGLTYLIFSMKIDAKNLPQSQIELSIELSCDEFQPFIQKAVENISEGLKIDGFRAGKVPMEVLKQHVSEMEIYEETARFAIQKTLSDYLREKNIPFLGQPKVDIEKLVPGNPLMFRAVITTLPEIQIPDLDAIKKVKREQVIITQEHILKALGEISIIHRKEIAKNEPSTVGDKMVLDFEIYRDNVLLEDGKQNNFELVLGDKVMIPGFEDHVLGLKINDTKEFNLEFPKKFFQKELAGMKADFKVKVKGVFSLEYPEINDDFAKTLGQFQTLDEVKKYIHNTLEIEAVNREAKRFEQEIIETILEKTTVLELPEILIDSEQKKIVLELKGELEQNQLKWDDYLKHAKKSLEEVEKSYRSSAVQRVKLSLLTRKLSKQEKLFATTAEIDVEQKKHLDEHTDFETQKHIQSPEYRDYIQSVLNSRKVIGFLKEKVGEQEEK